MPVGHDAQELLMMALFTNRAIIATIKIFAGMVIPFFYNFYLTTVLHSCCVCVND